MNTLVILMVILMQVGKEILVLRHLHLTIVFDISE